MAYMAGAFLGALLITYLLMRLYRRIFRQISGNGRTVAAFIATALTCTVLAGFGMANGGPPVFMAAFTRYIVPCTVWFLWFLFKSEPATVATA
ncbi:MAG TPA: hypothetical protein VK478_10715 [Gemmatimonadaceae bacterium]|nr:hypothetical protein [Gemmatimonadaceae bacterium]